MPIPLHGRVPDELSPGVNDTSEDGEDDEESTEGSDGDEGPQSPISGSLVEAAFRGCVGDGEVVASVKGAKDGRGGLGEGAAGELGGVAGEADCDASDQTLIDRELNGPGALLEAIENEMNRAVGAQLACGLDEALRDGSFRMLRDVHCQIASRIDLDGRAVRRRRHVQTIVLHVYQLVHDHGASGVPHTIAARQNRRGRTDQSVEVRRTRAIRAILSRRALRSCQLTHQRNDAENSHQLNNRRRHQAKAPQTKVNFESARDWNSRAMRPLHL